jgi:AcrR family transcriptional regulator
MARAKTRRLGRPSGAISVETRDRILKAGEKCFAQFGYDKTTNKNIADEAGLTTGALYHYFDSKQDLFLSVLQQQQQFVLSSFESVAEQETTAVDKLCAVMDRAVELHANDPYIARFVSIAGIEIDRHEEFQAFASTQTEDAFPGVPTRSGGIRQFFDDIVRVGKDTGEIPADVDTDSVVNMLLATTSGLAQFAGLVRDVGVHRDAMDAFKTLIRGRLFTTGGVARPVLVKGRRAGRRALRA